MACEKMDVCYEQETPRCDCNLSVKDINGGTALHAMYYAGLYGTSSKLEEAFLQGNDTKFINCVDRHGVSHFHLCCTLNHPDLVKVFLAREEDVNCAISFSCSMNPGFTPLHFAVTHNCTEVVELLLRHGADCKKGDSVGNTALHLACEKTGDVDGKIIDMLLEFGASPAAANVKGVTPLHIVFDKVDLRESIIDKFCSRIPRKVVNLTDDKGLSYFHIFCTRDDASRVSDFLQSDVAINSRVELGPFEGYAALHFAVLCNRIDIVELLLRNNAEIDIKTSFRLTPLHIACKFYMKYSAMDIRSNYNPDKVDWAAFDTTDLPIVELLLRNGADPNIKDILGQTPLIQTCTVDQVSHSHTGTSIESSVISEKFRDSKKKILQLLLSYNADINIRSFTGETILHAITKSDFLDSLNEDLVEYLIIQGADVNATDNFDHTPLHFAVDCINPTLVNLFLKYQANVNAQTRYEYNLLENAISNFKLFSTRASKEVIITLLEHGAHVNILNESGRTLLEGAVKSRMPFLVQHLLRNGADINLKSTRAFKTTSFLKKWHRKLTDCDLVARPAFGKIIKIIYTHVQKSLALGLHVDEKMQKISTRLLKRLQYAIQNNRKRCTKIPSINFASLKKLRDNCDEELKRMKNVKISNSTSLYDVLFIKDAEILSKHMRSSAIVEIMEEPSSFPLYSFMLNRQFNKALKRRVELDNAKTSLKCISQINIPDLCCDEILKFLSTNEIANLNTAVIGKR